MIEKDIIITNKLGIHARPASLIVRTVLKYNSEVTISKDGVTANAKSIMDVMMLAATQDSLIKLQVTGEDEDEAVKEILSIFEANFDE